ncbi:hypothetical protein BDU57DRAFT_461620 [Ampelomyces quisqualis]|uniref:Uncharacterized protein n=1 Tax=Ampelomyces quisqualis TaxID=50730 RepID=A0A6A5Q967_AMPQU|nr:hypothetical protein BDU57DRAFT_461620 [Ampelomyces quisqualis]
MRPSRAQEIVDGVHGFIEEERRRNFYFLGQHSHRYTKHDELLVVSPATSEEIDHLRKSDRDGQLIEYLDADWFTFTEPISCNSSSHTVAITLPQDEAASIGNMTFTVPLLKDAPKSSTAVTWLHETYDWDDMWSMKFREQQLEEQRIWWASTGKAFRLLNLPLELRELVYLHTIGPVVLPDLCKRMDFGKGLAYRITKRIGRNRDPDFEAPNMKIALLNKKVHHEALLVANRDTFKRLRAVGFRERSSASTKPALCITGLAMKIALREPRATFLRNVQLEMSAAACFESIGQKMLNTSIAFQPYARRTFYLNSLIAFPALQNLDFRFISPQHPDAICPWYNSAQPDKHSCQKVWIEWFFALGFTILANLRETKPALRFSLSGCVKTSTKTYWEHLLNDKHTDHMPAILAKRKEIREKRKENSMLKCECSYPCDRLGRQALGKKVEWEEEELRRIVGLRGLVDDGYWSFLD